MARPTCSQRGLCALLLLAASAGPLAVAGDPDESPAALHTDVRRQILLEFKYTGPQGDSARTAPASPGAQARQQASAAQPRDPALVTMAPFEVRETVKADALRAEFLRQKTDAQKAEIMSKLGIGVHVAPMGPVGFYAVTVFHIPIAVGFGISF
jgi:hypothetical protein